MPITLFEDALNFFWRPENDGTSFHVTKGDSGGATSWGVTYSTWIGWRMLHKVSGPGGTLVEFERLTTLDFQPFYRSAFWNAIQGDHLPAGVGLAVFDAAGMSGVNRASRWLQRVTGATQDGEIGPLTLERVRATDPGYIIQYFTAARRSYYADVAASNENDRQFLTGWYRRANDCQIAALKAVAG